MRGPPLGRLAGQAVLVLFTLVALVPVYVMLSASLRTQGEFLNHPFAFPLHPTLTNFRTALSDSFPRWLFNSVVLSGGSVLVTLVVAALAAWGFSRWTFPGRETLLTAIVALMVVPPVVLLVPLFLMGVQLDLINTFRLVIVIYVGLMLPFSIYMLTAYFRTIPRALLDAATIDGASEVRVFLQHRPAALARADADAARREPALGLERALDRARVPAERRLTDADGRTDGVPEPLQPRHPGGDGGPLARDAADPPHLPLRPALLHARPRRGSHEGRMTRIHHTGLTVSNLDRSLAFWRDALGMQVVMSQEKEGGYLEAIVLEHGAHVKMAHLAFAPDGPRIELFEYLAPAGGRAVHRPADVGFSHVCILCDDIDALLARLVAAGGTPFTDVVEVDTGANSGGRCLYLRDPDGHVVELFQTAPAGGAS